MKLLSAANKNHQNASVSHPSLKLPTTRSPFQIFFIISGSTFLLEMLLMLLFDFWQPNVSELGLAFMDATFLTFLISPTLYVFLLRPMLAQVCERQKSEANLEMSQRLASLGSWEWNLVKNTGLVSETWKKIFSIDAADAGQAMQQFIRTLHPDDREAVLQANEDSGRNGTPNDIEYRILLPDGQERFVHALSNVEVDSHGKPVRIYGTVQDITERKQLLESLRLSSLVLENSSEGMVVTDENNLIIAVNPAFTAMTGYTFDEVKGKDPGIFNSGRHDKAFYQEMWHALNSTGHWHGEIWDKRKNGDFHAKLLTINTIYHEDGGVHRYVALFSDITEKKQSEKLIWRQANFDSLTGLPNRDMFHDRMEQEMKKSQRAELSLAMLLIDLDQFKEVNDTLGHAVGDDLLQAAARRIRTCVRDSDTVARLGGDEFIIILPLLADTGHAEDIAQKIINRLSEPFHLGSEIIYVSASIGITLYPDDATDINTLMKNADQAMYAAKNKGRNRYNFFTPALQQAAQTRLRLTKDLRGALAANQLMVYFQPIVELSTGRIHKAEALLRWQHPERGMVSPGEFIPIAEESGLIHEIGDWVFKESARWVQRWSKMFSEDFQISVNKSPEQFSDRQISVNVAPMPVKASNKIFAENWLHQLEEFVLTGKNIVVEITEGLLLNTETDILNKLLKFRDAGIQVAIDDFGTGYSSLSYLKKFDIDYLKIDQSFVTDLEKDPNDMALSKAIIVMAHELGLKVIAEGVETEGQRNLLGAAGCDYAQGFLFSKAVPPEEFERLLAA